MEHVYPKVSGYFGHDPAVAGCQLFRIFGSGAKRMLDVSGRTNSEIKQLLIRVWLRQLAIGLLVFAVGCLFTGTGAGMTALAGGVLWGVLDGALLLGGIARALGVSIWQSRALRWRIFMCRVITGIAIIAGMLCLKLRVAEAFIAYLVLHILFFVNLQYFTNPKK